MEPAPLNFLVSRCTKLQLLIRVPGLYKWNFAENLNSFAKMTFFAVFMEKQKLIEDRVINNVGIRRWAD
jgi:hypothetical protein